MCKTVQWINQDQLDCWQFVDYMVENQANMLNAFSNKRKKLIFGLPINFVLIIKSITIYKIYLYKKYLAKKSLQIHKKS